MEMLRCEVRVNRAILRLCSLASESRIAMVTRRIALTTCCSAFHEMAGVDANGSIHTANKA